MKFLAKSDVHVEFHDLYSKHKSSIFAPYDGDADVIIVAGDIHTQGRGPKWLRQVFDHQEIVLISGNHEYYNSTIEQQEELIRKQCKQFHVHYLQRDTITIGGLVIAGCTLWTDFGLFGADRQREAMFEARQYMMDYHRIFVDSKRLRNLSPLATLKIHQKDVDWLQNQSADIIVTHHGPSAQCVHLDYKDDLLSAAFASDLDWLIESSGAKYWICGHSHIAQRFKIGKTTVIQNCLGYPDEQISGFKFDLILEI